MDHAQNWKTPASTESILEEIQGLHPAIQRLIQVRPDKVDVECYTMSARDPLRTLYRGKAVLVGEAAHPTALEECAALEIFLEGVGKSVLDDRLNAYNNLMLPRCAVVQMRSSHHSGLDDAAMHKLRCPYHGSLPEQAMPFSKGYRDFFYERNIFNEVKEMVSKATYCCSGRGLGLRFVIWSVQLRGGLPWYPPHGRFELNPVPMTVVTHRHYTLYPSDISISIHLSSILNSRNTIMRPSNRSLAAFQALIALSTAQSPPKFYPPIFNPLYISYGGKISPPGQLIPYNGNSLLPNNAN